MPNRREIAKLTAHYFFQDRGSISEVYDMIEDGDTHTIDIRRMNLSPHTNFEEWCDGDFETEMDDLYARMMKAYELGMPARSPRRSSQDE